jgi:thymidylate synthase (FAD)
MKLIESKAEYIPQEEGLEGIYKAIELAGRTAYHSQDKITPDSAKDFVDRMIKSKHGVALEHGTVYLFIPQETNYEVFERYIKNNYSHTFEILILSRPKGLYVVTNYRVLAENNWLDDLQYLCSPTEFHEKRYTMRFTCSRAIANELVRHRTMSFLQESTRYINYSKERHGGEITFIIPSWIDRNREPNTEAEIAWLDAMKKAESAYLDMVNGITRKGIVVMSADEKLTPQQARDVLPNATKTELIMTGFSSDWKHVMDLRLFGKTGAPHPDMIDLMQKAQKAMQEAGIWEDIMSKPSKFE